MSRTVTLPNYRANSYIYQLWNVSLWEGQMFESRHLWQLVRVMGRDRINSEDTCLKPATASLCTGLVWWPHWLGCVIRMEGQWKTKVVSQCGCIASSRVLTDDENIPWMVLMINLEVVCVIQSTCKGQLVPLDLFWSWLVPHCLYSWNALCAMTHMKTASSLQKAEATNATLCLLLSWSKQ